MIRSKSAFQTQDGRGLVAMMLAERGWPMRSGELAETIAGLELRETRPPMLSLTTRALPLRST